MHKNSALLYFLILLLVSVSACQDVGSNKPSPLAITSVTGATTTPAGQSKLSLVWRTELSHTAQGLWTALIQKEVLYYATDKSTIAYDLTSRQQLWAVPEDSAVTLLAGEKELVISKPHDDELIARAKSSGSEIWRIALPTDFDPVEKGVAVSDNLVFIGSRHKISAVVIETGKTIWSYEAPNNFVVVNGEPPMVKDPSDGQALAFNQGTLYAHLTGPFQPTQPDDGSIPLQGSAEMKLLAIDAASGKRLWDFPYTFKELSTTAGPPIHNPVFYQDWVLLPVPQFVVLEKNTGQVSKQIDEAMTGLSPVMQDSYLVVTGKEELSAFDIKSSEKLWTVTGFKPRSKPVINNGVIFLIAEIAPEYRTGMLAIDLHTGAIINKVETVFEWGATPYVLEMAVDSSSIYIVTSTHVYQFEFKME